MSPFLPFYFFVRLLPPIIKKKKLAVKQAENRGKKTRWKPGQSSNPKDRPKKRDSLVSLLKEVLEKEYLADKKGRTWAEVLTEQLLLKAVKGDMVAQRLIWEYVEGKPKQEIEIPSDINIHIKYADEIKK